MEQLLELLPYFTLFLTGVTVGCINTAAGGGSLLTLPIMIDFLGFDPHQANATNRLGIFASTFFATRGFASKGYPPNKYSISLGIAAFIGAILGAYISTEVPDDVLVKVISIVIIFASIAIIFNRNEEGGLTGVIETKGRKGLGIFLFFIFGIYGGFIQAGVGFLMIAALGLLHHYSLTKINSYKVLITCTFTIAALAVFIWKGNVLWMHGVALAAGTATGGWLMSRWSTTASGMKWIKPILVVMLIIMAVKLWFFPSGS